MGSKTLQSAWSLSTNAIVGYLENSELFEGGSNRAM